MKLDSVAIDLLFGFIDRAAKVWGVIQAAKAEGRPVSKEELDALVVGDDVAKVALEAGIAKAKAEGGV